jgi:hypothetical protein
LTENFENRNEYEYLTNQGYVKGNAGLSTLKSNPKYVIAPGVSELSVYYNNYLDQYMAVYLKNSNIIYVTTSDLSVSFGKTVVITNDAKHSGLYAGCVSQALTAYNGQKFYLLISRWHVYNVQFVEVVLK